VGAGVTEGSIGSIGLVQPEAKMATMQMNKIHAEIRILFCITKPPILITSVFVNQSDILSIKCENSGSYSAKVPKLPSFQ
jgi:hypothetical protein